MKRQINNETPEEKQNRKREASRKSSADHRARETPDQKVTRLTKNRDSTRIRRANATVLQTEARLEADKIRSQESRAAENTPDNADRLEAQRIRSQESRAAENTPDSADRLEAQRIRSQLFSMMKTEKHGYLYPQALLSGMERIASRIQEPSSLFN